jgi:hypothetical protein
MFTTVPCKTCGATVEVEVGGPVEALSKRYGIYCTGCAEENREQRVCYIQEPPPFDTFCPPCFPDTRIDSLPCAHKSKAALGWCYGPIGLNLWGLPGTGKTRTMSLLLQAIVADHKSVIAFGPGDFRAGCEARNWKRASWLKKLSRVDVLFIDDLDKMNLTREMEKDFFAVLNNRMGRRPVFMTGNSDGEEIEYRFKLGEPLVRRIRDHCLSIHFGKVDITNKPNTLPL